MRSAWATIFIWVIAMACARQCNGPPVATPASRRLIRRSSICRLIFDPEYHYEAVNVEAQQNNVHSLLWWTKRLLGLRKRHQAFGRGDLHILSSDNPKTLAFARRWDNETILVVANLSRFTQCAGIDLSEFKGMTLVEMLGPRRFPPVSDPVYCLALGPYAFYWFAMTPQDATLPTAAKPPILTVSGSAGWESVFRGKAKLALEAALPAYLQTRRWYQGLFRTLKAVTVRDAIRVPSENHLSRIALLQVEYIESDPEWYVLPLAFAADSAPHTEAGATAPVVARLRVRSRGEGETVEGVLYEPCGDRDFIASLLDLVTKGGRLEGDAGDLRGEPSPNLGQLPEVAEVVPHLVELSNTSAILQGRGVLLKLYRRVEEGVHPEVEVLRYFARTGSFPHTPRLLGVLEYKQEAGESMTAGLLREFAVGQGDAWNLTLDSLHRLFDLVLTGALGRRIWKWGRVHSRSQ